MIYNKNNLVIAAIASKGSREELTGVYFKNDRTVATDSVKLIEVKNPESFEKQAGDYPPALNNGRDKVMKEISKKGYIIPAKNINKVLKNLAEVKSKNLPILENAVFLSNGDEETSRIATTDLEKTDIVAGKNIKGTFPDYERIMADTRINHSKVLISVNQLKPVLDILDKMNLTGDKQLELHVCQEGDKPLTIKAKTLEGQDITALVMPLKQ